MNVALRRRGSALVALAAAAAAAVVSIACVLVAYRASSLIPIGAVGVAGLFVVSWRQPLVVVAAALAIIPLSHFAVHAGIGIFSPAEILLLLAAFSWMARGLAEGRALWTPSPLGKPLGLLTLLILPGVITAANATAVVKAFVIWAAFLVVYQIIVTEASRESVRYLALALAVAAGIVGLMALIESHGGTHQVIGASGDASGRPVGAFAQPNELAAFLAAGLPLTLMFAFGAERRLRLIGAVSAGLTFAGLAVSLSRGGLIAGAVACVALLAWRPFRRAVLVGAAIVGMLFAIGWSPVASTKAVGNVGQRIATLTSAQSSDPRAQIWSTTPRIIADHPLFGVGTNNFQNVAIGYGLVDPTTVTAIPHAHDFALTLAAERGIPALLAFLWLVVALVAVIRRALRGNVGSERAIAIAVAAATAGMLAKGLFDYDIGNNVVAAVLFVLLGCIAVLGRPTPDSDPLR